MIELVAASVHRSGMWHRLSSFIFGEPVPGRLPARVRERIARQQLQSEKLISWVQVALVLLFANLWAVSPKGPDTHFDLVPAALAFYFAFTLVRMAAAYRNALNTPLLTASVVIDMALLMVLIWSFHIKYMQPASFYLKAPTLMYVFIFIGLRTLRFEPGYIILAGASAAAGWLGLMIYALHSQTEYAPMLTRDFIVYMTSNAILIGAEVDKIVSILLVTGVLAIAVLRARRSLYRAIIESTAAQDLTRFVSKEVAERITTADQAIQPGEGESRVASILFTDIEGFSTVSEKMSPGELARTLNDYFQTVGEIITNHGGVVMLFEGDAMLITFNAVTPTDDHASQAMDCALEIQQVCETRMFGSGVRLPTRCGVNTGAIVVGAVGTAERLTFTVHGDNVNIAARLEQLNKDYGTYVMCTQETVDACDGGYACSFKGEIPVKGRAQPVKVYAVDGN